MDTIQIITLVLGILAIAVQTFTALVLTIIVVVEVVDAIRQRLQ